VPCWATLLQAGGLLQPALCGPRWDRGEEREGKRGGGEEDRPLLFSSPGGSFSSLLRLEKVERKKKRYFLSLPLSALLWPPSHYTCLSACLCLSLRHRMLPHAQPLLAHSLCLMVLPAALACAARRRFFICASFAPISAVRLALHPARAISHLLHCTRTAAAPFLFATALASHTVSLFAVTALLFSVIEDNMKGKSPAFLPLVAPFLSLSHSRCGFVLVLRLEHLKAAHAFRFCERTHVTFLNEEASRFCVFAVFIFSFWVEVQHLA